MEFLLKEYEERFEDEIERACMYLVEVNTAFMEAVYEAGYIMESEYDTFTTKVKKFFEKILSALSDFKNHLKQQINATLRKKEYNKRLHKLREELVQKRDEGISEIETTDVITLGNTYIDMVKDLSEYAKKFTKMKYTSTTEIDRDLEKYHKKVDEYEKKLEKLMDKKIRISTQKMLDFVEREISNQSKVMKTIADCMDTIEQIRDQVESLETKKNIIGADILTGYTRGVRGVTKTLSFFVKTWTVKVITTIVFVFA